MPNPCRREPEHARLRKRLLTKARETWPQLCSRLICARENPDLRSLQDSACECFKSVGTPARRIRSAMLGTRHNRSRYRWRPSFHRRNGLSRPLHDGQAMPRYHFQQITGASVIETKRGQTFPMRQRRGLTLLPLSGRYWLRVSGLITVQLPTAASYVTAQDLLSPRCY
jgi:hypothetical protein